MSPQKKLQKKPTTKSNTFKIIAITIPTLLVMIIGFNVIKNNVSDTAALGNTNNKTSTTGKTTTVINKNSDLIINVSDLSDKAKFYPIQIDGTKLEVLGVKAPDGTIRTAFNTCQVCYSSGRGYYVQEGNFLVCQNCGNRFKMNEVEVTKGGCNPVPISSGEKTVTSTSITISKEYLAQAKSIFANWKS